MSKKLTSSNDALQIHQHPLENIENLILNIRGKQVMLDRDLARLYGVETKVLNQAVKRNLERFPEDFMFQLTNEEFENWKSQIVTSNWMTQKATSNSIIMGARKLPNALRLDLDLQRHNTQYPPINVHNHTTSHDRFLIIDDTEVYHLGASLKDLGKKLFAFSKLNIPPSAIL